MQFTPLDMLKHLMDANDLSVADLGSIIEDEFSAKAILNGEMPIAESHAERLGNRFKVNKNLFLKTGRCREDASNVEDEIELLRVSGSLSERDSKLLEFLSGLTSEQRALVDYLLKADFEAGVREGRARQKYSEQD